MDKLLKLFQIPQRYRFSSKSQLPLRLCSHVKVVLDTTKVQIFKQITTFLCVMFNRISCFRYHKGTDFQANHNGAYYYRFCLLVVLDTTKVQIFKQITTERVSSLIAFPLFQIPQRYRFSSKSQLEQTDSFTPIGCFRYHKGTDFQANHNTATILILTTSVVLDTTKVQIFKQITTCSVWKSVCCSCFRYHKGTDFQANHNCTITH